MGRTKVDKWKCAIGIHAAGISGKYCLRCGKIFWDKVEL